MYCCCLRYIFKIPLTVINVSPPSKVRCKVFSIDSKSKRPTIEEIVGKSRAPQKTRVAETGSESVGVAGFWRPGSSSSSLNYIR